MLNKMILNKMIKNLPKCISFTRIGRFKNLQDLL